MSANQALIEYFRCPETFANFELLGPGSGQPGYFRFGPNEVCYGHVSAGFTSDDVQSELYDASLDVRMEHGACLIPFDPTAIVDNLRRERYVSDGFSDSSKILRSGFVRNAYYAIRPILPVPVRRHLQRLSLRGWNHKPFPCWPIDRSVDRIFERLLHLALVAQGLDKIPFVWFWPEGKSACAIMTHDVETKTGLDFCSSLMDLNDSYGIKSSFQIVPEGRYRVQKQMLDEIVRRGFEVNIHDWNHDGFLFSDRSTFLSRAPKINQVAAKWGAEGFRAGVMYRNTDWFEAFTFSYDLSIPNVGYLDPQPGGCCTVLPFFVGGILEIPLTTIQDYPLFHILRDYTIDLWKRQISSILEGNGLISSLVHPDYILERRAQSIYREFLTYLSALRSEKNIWFALPREVNRWWRDRNQMRLVQRNGRWEIDGPGKERARIAYAYSDGQHVTYRIE